MDARVVLPDNFVAKPKMVLRLLLDITGMDYVLSPSIPQALFHVFFRARQAIISPAVLAMVVSVIAI
jgi:hypothetical protein